MNRLIYRYIIREIASLFLLGIVIFTLILLLGRLLKLTELVVSRGVSLSIVASMVGYLLPSFLVFTIPMAFLLAVLLAFGRLSSDNEIVVLKACGISLTQLMPPVFVCAVIASVFAVGTGVYGVPWGNSSFKQLSYQVLKQNALSTICEKVFWDDIPGIVMYSEHYDDQCLELKGVVIHDGRNPAQPMTIFAKNGYVATAGAQSIKIVLKDGSIHSAGKEGAYRLIHFGEYTMSIGSPGTAKGFPLNETDMSISELNRLIARPVAGAPSRNKLLSELHSRFAFPFASIVFAVVALPLGIQNRRSGKSAGFTLSIAILLVYYLLMSLMRTLGEQGAVPPVVAMWIPNVVFLSLGCYLLNAASQERGFNIPGPADIVAAIKARMG